MTYQQFSELPHYGMTWTNPEDEAQVRYNKIELRKNQLSNIIQNIGIERDAITDVQRLTELKSQYEQCQAWMLDLQEELERVYTY